MTDSSILPPELWLEVFDWVTCTPCSRSTSAYVPFQPIFSQDKLHGGALQTIKSIYAVCKSWRALVQPLLYGDIHIHREGAEELQHALGCAQANSGRPKGELVRRAVLPYSTTAATTSSRSDARYLDILKLCSRLEVLVRPPIFEPDFPTFDFETHMVPLPSLRRLDWYHIAEAERTGGINSLGAVLRHTPNLRYLMIAGVTGLTRVCMDQEPIRLAALETLRLNGVNGLLLHQMTRRWSLPKLARLILDTPVIDQLLAMLCEAFGPQLTTLELGKHVRFLTADHISKCLKTCPDLAEINYHIFFTMPPRLEDGVTYPHLRTVGLDSCVNQMLPSGGTVWDHLHQHFHTFSAGDRFPKLQRLVLYGDWKPILEHPMFEPIRRQLSENKELEIVVRCGRNTL